MSLVPRRRGEYQLSVVEKIALIGAVTAFLAVVLQLTMPALVGALHALHAGHAL